ncbi:hypothetical protein H4R18_001032 [Coemansia javaensis]|uniref:Uncharacterized protein n=1 Tax=Coemansia javaensis TaxID=2761396 RepID=A0A9W8LLX3_9FUNG|nr:hypothetical protein H4R18_001032 [Coemansia javaensis]
MYLRDLPDDILRLVFKWTASTRTTVVAAFKADRPLIARMQDAAKLWRAVKTLDMYIYPEPRVPSGGAASAPGYDDGIKRTAAALATTIPEVRYVTFSITMSADCTFRGLTSTYIPYERGIGYQHPRVDPATLVSLTLHGWPSDHSWAPFSADDSDAETIEFPNLARLNAIYYNLDTNNMVEVRHRDGHPWKLRLPKLRRLSVNCAQDACPVLEYAVLPAHIDEIHIRAKMPVLHGLSKTPLPASRRLKIDIAKGSSDDSDALAAAQQILECAGESKELALYVSGEAPPVPPASITCTRLTELEIWSPMGVDAMLALIRKLPGLATMVLLGLALDNIQENIAVPKPENSRLAEPFDTRIKTLRIGTVNDEEDLGVLASVAKYLLLRIPTLAVARFSSLKRPVIAEFVRAYSTQYPHLANVDFGF